MVAAVTSIVGDGWEEVLVVPCRRNLTLSLARHCLVIFHHVRIQKIRVEPSKAFKEFHDHQTQHDHDLVTMMPTSQSFFKF